MDWEGQASAELDSWDKWQGREVLTWDKFDVVADEHLAGGFEWGRDTNGEQGEQPVLVTSHMVLWECKKGISESQEKQWHGSQD